MNGTLLIFALAVLYVLHELGQKYISYLRDKQVREQMVVAQGYVPPEKSEAEQLAYLKYQEEGLKSELADIQTQIKEIEDGQDDDEDPIEQAAMGQGLVREPTTGKEVSVDGGGEPAESDRPAASDQSDSQGSELRVRRDAADS